MKIWNYNLNSNKKYRIKLKDTAKWNQVNSPVGRIYKNHFIEVSDNSHFEDLINFMPHIWIQSREMNGEWVTFHESEQKEVKSKPKPKVKPKPKKKAKKKDEFSEFDSIEPINNNDSEEEIPETNLDDLSKVEPMEDKDV